jgi:hypothetical protein
MTRKVNVELRQEWRQRIERQRQSGFTAAEFSRREGVSSATFYAWKRRLQGKSPSKSKRAARRRPAAAPAPAVGPVPKALSDASFVQLPLAPGRTSPWIELVLLEGTVIRVPQQNLTALQTVLHALSSVPCSPSLGAARHA